MRSLWVALLLVIALPAFGADGITQKLDAQAPLDTVFQDEAGQAIPLRSYFGKKPVILAMAYYECPNLCTLVLNGLADAIAKIPQGLGRDYDVVTVSINPRETARLALMKKRTYLARLGRAGKDVAPWHFLTGDEASIRKLANAVGFGYSYDPSSGDYTHGSGVIVLTPEGRVSRYLFGIQFAPRELGAALTQASRHGIGALADEILLFCSHYRPSAGKYGLLVLDALRVGSLLTLFLLGSWIFWGSWKERA